MEERRPVEMLEREHRFIERVIGRMAVLAEGLEKGQEADAQVLGELVEFMRRYADECHHGKEETYLFPALERRGVPLTGCPLGTLAFEHQKGRTMVKHLSESADDYVKNGRASSESLIKSLRSLLELYPNHIWKEDYLLFPMSNKVLSPEDQKELMVQFEEVDNRIGPEVIARLEQRALDFEAAARR